MIINIPEIEGITVSENVGPTTVTYEFAGADFKAVKTAAAEYAETYRDAFVRFSANKRLLRTGTEYWMRLTLSIEGIQC